VFGIKEIFRSLDPVGAKSAAAPLREIALSYAVDHSTICRLKPRRAAEMT
jgi:hypothetical protein